MNKIELLAKYAGKTPTEFYQMDGFSGVPGDDVMRGDENGYCVMSGDTTELMTSRPDVRVLIPKGVDKNDVIALLGQIIAEVKDDNFKGHMETLRWFNGISTEPEQSLELAMVLAKRRRMDVSEDGLSIPF